MEMFSRVIFIFRCINFLRFHEGRKLSENSTHAKNSRNTIVMLHLTSHFNLVNTIETKPLCGSSSNFAHMLTTMRGCTPLIFKVKG